MILKSELKIGSTKKKQQQQQQKTRETWFQITRDIASSTMLQNTFS